jgi:hypothetical protein
MGLEVPTDMDGKVLSPIFKPDSYFSLQQVRYMEEGRKKDIRSLAQKLMKTSKLRI